MKVGNSSFYQTDTLVVSSFAYCRNGANDYVFGYGVSKGLDMGFIMGMDGYLGLYFRLLWFRVCGSIIFFTVLCVHELGCVIVHAMFFSVRKCLLVRQLIVDMSSVGDLVKV